MRGKLLLFLCSFLFPFQVLAYDFEINGIFYNKKFEGVEVTCQFKNEGNQSTYSGYVVIPDTVVYEGKRYPVTSIDNYAFYNCGALDSIFIPNTVVNIGYDAFRKCINLVSVILPKRIKEISMFCFENCSKLSSVIIPNGVSRICHNAFWGCINLQEIEIPSSVKVIESDAFKICGLISIEIPDSIVCINESTFAFCESLISVKIPPSVTKICKNAFHNCSSLSYLYVQIQNPKSCNVENAFSYSMYESSYLNRIKLCVSHGNSEVFKETLPWKKCKEIEEFDYDEFNAFISPKIVKQKKNRTRSAKLQFKRQ